MINQDQMTREYEKRRTKKKKKKKLSSSDWVSSRLVRGAQTWSAAIELMNNLTPHIRSKHLSGLDSGLSILEGILDNPSLFYPIPRLSHPVPIFQPVRPGQPVPLYLLL